MKSTSNRKKFALLGISILVIGVFMPLYQLGFSDEAISYLNAPGDNTLDADGHGVYVLIVAAVALFLILIERLEYLWMPAVLVFWGILNDLNTVWIICRSFGGGELRAGWFVMLGGLVFMTVPLWIDMLLQFISNPASLFGAPKRISMSEEKTIDE